MESPEAGFLNRDLELGTTWAEEDKYTSSKIYSLTFKVFFLISSWIYLSRTPIAKFTINDREFISGKQNAAEWIVSLKATKLSYLDNISQLLYLPILLIVLLETILFIFFSFIYTCDGV